MADMITLDSATSRSTQLKSANGAACVTDIPLNSVTYAGGGYTYYCQSVGGSALNAAVWQVMRKTEATGTMTYAGTGSTFGAFAHLATDLATVAALVYNGGVTL